MFDSAGGQRCAGVVGSGHQQPAPGGQHAGHLLKPAFGISDMLDYLAGPDQVELPVVEWQRTVERDEAEIELWMRCPRSRKRGLRHLDAGHHSSRRRKHRGERTGAAAEVEGTVPPSDLTQQEAATKVEFGGLEPLLKPLPDLFVVVLHPIEPNSRRRAAYRVRVVAGTDMEHLQGTPG